MKEKREKMKGLHEGDKKGKERGKECLSAD